MEANRRRICLLVALGFWVGPAAGCTTDPPCQLSAKAALAWTEQTAWGTPEQLFSRFAGSCQAPFQWSSGGGSGIFSVDPPQGQSTLTVTVAVDSTSARRVIETPASCPSMLQVDGTVTLELPEGKVADQRPVTLSALMASGLAAPASFSFALDEKDFGPWVSIRKADPQISLGMTIEVTALDLACSGEIQLSWRGARGDVSLGGTGQFATWSDTGCGVGQSAVRLDQPWQGIDLAATISATFGQVTLPGTWSGGGATTLSLATSLPDDVACAEVAGNGLSEVTIPADIVASTADGLVRGLSGRGNIRVTANQAGWWELQLSLSTDMSCASETDALPYAGADCATVSKVTAQLSITRSAANPTSDSGTLDLYAYQRQAPAGAAARWDELVLGP